MPKPNVTGVQSATEWTASVHILHMPKPNVTRVQSATEWAASVHTLHMPKPNVSRVQSATEWTASVHTLHMPKPNVTRVQSATEWTASVHTLHMPKPSVTRVQSATEWTASVHTLHMPKPNVTRVQSAMEWTASVHTLHMPKPNVTRVQSATEWTASVHTLHMPKPNVTRVQSATEWTASVHTLHMPKPNEKIFTYLYAWVWRYHLPKNANFKVELAKICWPSSLPAAPKKEAANSTCRNTIAVKSTKHKLSLKPTGFYQRVTLFWLHKTTFPWQLQGPNPSRHAQVLGEYMTQTSRYLLIPDAKLNWRRLYQKSIASSFSTEVKRIMKMRLDLLSFWSDRWMRLCGSFRGKAHLEDHSS